MAGEKYCSKNQPRLTGFFIFVNFVFFVVT